MLTRDLALEQARRKGSVVKSVCVCVCDGSVEGVEVRFVRANASIPQHVYCCGDAVTFSG
jgi:hypothetical protein